MKNLFTTTTGDIASQMILDHAGDYAGKYQHEAFELLNQVTDVPEFEGHHWADIMFDQTGRVYAVWAEDALTCQSADAVYVELEYDDCPSAFNDMKNKN